jgi:hypothetical protein
MPTEKVWSSYKQLAEFDTFVGEVGEIFFEPSTGDIRLSDGSTPGGLPITFKEIRFDTTHVTTGEPEGSLCWNPVDQTVNLFHSNGVVHQVGQELYGYVRNNTGNTIANGSAVRFAGAEQNGEARLEVAPMIANGTFPTLYGFGVATENIEDGADGRITVWGKVRDIDTTGPGDETWNVGDILYVSPNTAGDLTNIKPTAPDNVIPMAAVLNVDATEGELFVRPSYEQQKNYGVFSSTIDQTLDSANTAGNVTFNTAGSAQQISIDSEDSTKIVFGETGLYFTIFHAQLTSTNSSAKDVRFWVAQNGNNIPNSARVVTITGSDVFTPVSIAYNISITTANSHIQLRWATDNTAVSLDAVANTAYAPASPSVQVEIVQTAL